MTAETRDKIDFEALTDLAAQLRRQSIEATTTAGSGHPTSAMSAADLAAVLFGRHFVFDRDRPERLDNDRFVLSKGHAAPLLYSVMATFGLIERELLGRLREKASLLEGHPVPGVPMVDVATGSLGIGLSNGLGMALAQRLASLDARTWVLLGDSEMAEGSVWEAVELAGHMGVANLVAIVDMNRLGQRGATMHGWNGSSFTRRAMVLGWEALEIDGHDLDAIDSAMSAATGAERPTLLVARTIKGKGVSFVEDEPDRHGKPFDEEEAARALAELGDPQITEWSFAAAPSGAPPSPLPELGHRGVAATFDEPIATRDAFGVALLDRVGGDRRIVVLDGEVADSTRTKPVGEEFPERFVECFIAEQNMVGMAVGLQVLGFHPVAATFGAFFSRAHDVVRMGNIGRAHLTLVGSHAGVSIGEDGPSQMALDDIAMMRGCDSVVLYPADGTSTAALLDLALAHDGISYLRTTRGTTPVLYGADTSFELGGCHVHRSSDDDSVTIVAAGVTVFEALEASERLAEEGIGARVVDCYSVAPLDVATLAACLEETGALVVVEDHGRPGGIGEAVALAMAGSGAKGGIVSLAVTGMPGSAEPEEQRRLAGIDAGAVVEAVRKLSEG